MINIIREREDLAVLSRKENRGMLVRIISGALLLLCMGTGMILGNWWLFALCLFISVLGLFEFYKVVGIHKNIVGILGYVGTFALYAFLLFQKGELIMFVISMLTIIWMAIMVFEYPKYHVTQIALALLGVVYVDWMLSYIYQTRQLTNGIFYIWLIFISAWGSDSFAYLVGITIGKHKMTPKLSPKKSVEGAIGGIAGAAILGALYGWGMQFVVGSNLALAFMVASMLGAMVSIIGDLAASAVKRTYNIKDYGKIIPGHGGIMDRFDSVIFTAPIVYWVLYFFTR